MVTSTPTHKSPYLSERRVATKLLELSADVEREERIGGGEEEMENRGEEKVRASVKGGGGDEKERKRER